MLDVPGIALLEAIGGASNRTLKAAIFFGSRSSGVATNAASAYDLMLVCDEPRLFYRAMKDAGFLTRSPAILSVLDPFLAPTQVRLVGSGWLVKASVLSTSALTRATSASRKDQFVAGRLFQDVHVVWSRDAAAATEVAASIHSARAITLSWVGPDLPDEFDVAGYVRQLLRTSFRFEVRPETGGRADALFLAQADRLVPLFTPILDQFASEGRLIRKADGRFSRPADEARRTHGRFFLQWSRVRATARWPKHAMTFDGWLDYIVRKAERHSGETIFLSPWERRLPFLLLWPRLFRFLKHQRSRSRPV